MKQGAELHDSSSRILFLFSVSVENYSSLNRLTENSIFLEYVFSTMVSHIEPITEKYWKMKDDAIR